MARIRSLKPEAFQSETLGLVSVHAERTFFGMSTQADDRGRLRHKPVIINADLWAYRPTHTPDDLSEELEQLEAEGLVCVYVGCDGREYLHLVTWDEHQKIDRPSRSRLPLCPVHTVNLATSEADYCGRHEGPCPNDGPQHILASPREPSMQDLGSRTVDLGPTTSSSAIADAITDDDARPELLALCEHLADRIEANGSRRPRIGKRWLTAARLLLDTDGRSPDQVRAAIDWSQTDQFWRSNILSMPKLREKYDQLRLAAQRSQGRPGDQQLDHLREAMTWAQQHDAQQQPPAPPAIGA